jgi:hypothetical protein
MCGAVRFVLEQPAPDLVAVVADAPQLAEARYWGERPVLPVRTTQGGWQLVPWGNRNEYADIPVGGWAQRERLAQGGWQRYGVTEVVIPVCAGYEQGVWFAIDTGIHGIVVRHHSGPRVYMVTEAASAAYLELTHHPRQPWLIAQTDYPVLPGSRQQLGLGL